MISVGIEGTAHTLGIGIVENEHILADIRRTYSPKEGGIHPREASRYIADNFGSALLQALEEAGIEQKDIDLVSFSRGPGLGPCLSNVAVGARALSLHLKVPIVGVNHCVAHIEIGNLLASLEHPAWKQPLVLYVSGGNTQIIMFKQGRYRVFGETLDIGVGNLLDKFGRKAGLKHPAGPKIEKLATAGEKYIPLPYVVKGNDLSFSGILTEAVRLLDQHSLSDIAYSLQETVFSMLTEATERALCHLKSPSLLLTGGVGNNKRLQEMLKAMAEENGVTFSVPQGYCSDNGVMIAWTGLLMYRSGVRHKLEETQVDQNFRTDQVEIPWASSPPPPKEQRGRWKGAEAVLTLSDSRIKKRRLPKSYRLAEIDIQIRKGRTSREARLLRLAKKAGLCVPEIISVEPSSFELTMEYIEGDPLYKILDKRLDLGEQIGSLVSSLHANDIIPGDLTTSNMILREDRICLIDFGLGSVSRRAEDKATDLLLLKKSLNANHPTVFRELWSGILSSYKDPEVLERLRVVESRGRYMHA